MFSSIYAYMHVLSRTLLSKEYIDTHVYTYLFNLKKMKNMVVGNMFSGRAFEKFTFAFVSTNAQVYRQGGTGYLTDDLATPDLFRFSLSHTAHHRPDLLPSLYPHPLSLPHPTVPFPTKLNTAALESGTPTSTAPSSPTTMTSPTVTLDRRTGLPTSSSQL